MSEITQAQSISKPVSRKTVQILAGAILGLIVLSAVGFVPLEVIHNATHDARHAAGFPCH